MNLFFVDEETIRAAGDVVRIGAIRRPFWRGFLAPLVVAAYLVAYAFGCGGLHGPGDAWAWLAVAAWAAWAAFRATASWRDLGTGRGIDVDRDGIAVGSRPRIPWAGISAARAVRLGGLDYVVLTGPRTSVHWFDRLRGVRPGEAWVALDGLERGYSDVRETIRIALDLGCGVTMERTASTGRSAPVRVAARCLCLAFAVAYAGETFHTSGWPWREISDPDAVRHGALVPGMVGDGEWWRSLTGPWLHGGPAHLGFNVMATLVAGAALSGVVTVPTFLATWVLGALAGAAGTFLLHAPGAVSVGASGGIVALFGAFLPLGLASPLPESRVALCRLFVVVVGGTVFVLPALTFGATPDTPAHACGALAGMAFGSFAAWCRPRRLRAVSLGVCLAYGVALAAASWSGWDWTPPVPASVASGKR